MSTTKKAANTSEAVPDIKESSIPAAKNAAMSAAEKLRKMYEAQSIEAKDFSLKDLFSLSASVKPYQNEDGTATLHVKGIASKFVPKYCNENNRGYHTTLYLTDGKKTGAFSNALLQFAEFFFGAAGVELNEYARVTFDGEVEILISKVDLAGSKTTYNIEYVGGEFTGLERLGGAANYAALLPATDAID